MSENNREKAQIQTQTTTPNSSERRYDDNPFVAFRQFADEQFSSALQSIIGVPSLTSAPTRDNWAVFDNGDSYKGMGMQHFRNGADEQAGSKGSNDGSSASISSNNSSSSNNKDDNGDDDGRWYRREDPWHYSGRWIRHPTDIFNNIESLLFDRSWFDDRFPFSFGGLFDRHGPFVPDMMGDFEGSAAWPFTYIMFSPYSPLHLERQDRRGDRGVFSSIMSSLGFISDDSSSSVNNKSSTEPQWREAFEDLLRLENGKPMLHRDPAANANAASKKESGKEWLEGLVSRGSLGDNWKFVSGTDGHPWSGFTLEESSSSGDQNDRSNIRVDYADKKDTEDSSSNEETDNNPSTEAEIYDEFLKDIENRQGGFLSESPLMNYLLEERKKRLSEKSLPSSNDVVRDEERKTTSQQEVSNVQSSSNLGYDDNVRQQHYNPAGEPKVISTISSRERTRLADGSVRTKVVKTKRFADGREETNESEEFSNPPPFTSPSPARDPPQNGRAENKEEQENKDSRKGGWFWR